MSIARETGRDEVDFAKLELSFDNDDELDEDSTSEKLPSTLQLEHAHHSSLSPQKYPYKMSVWIKSARDLPAMDISGTSDPYVNVYMNHLLVGRTKTCYKTLNPDWGGEKYEIPLLHTSDNELVLEIMDDNRLHAADFIGKARINISVLPTSKYVDEWDFEVLTSRQKYRGTICIGYELAKNDKIIDMVPDVMLRRDVEKVSQTVADLLKSKLGKINASEPVKNEIYSSPVARHPERFMYFEDYMSDLMCDLGGLHKLLEKSRKEGERGSSAELNSADLDLVTTVVSALPAKVLKSDSYLQSSAQLDMESMRQGLGPEWTKGLPSDAVGLVLKYATEEEPAIIKTTTVTVKNRYVLRVLTTWLRLGIDLATQGENSYYYGDLPAFASKETYATRASVAHGNDTKKKNCQATVDLRKIPYTLAFTSGSLSLGEIHLATLVSLNVSRSTAGPQRLVMAMQPLDVVVSAFNTMTNNAAGIWGDGRDRPSSQVSDHNHIGREASYVLDGINPDIRSFGKAALGMTPTGHLLNLAQGFKTVVPMVVRDSVSNKDISGVGIAAQIDNFGQSISHAVIADSTMCYQMVIKHNSYHFTSKKSYGNVPDFGTQVASIDLPSTCHLLPGCKGWKTCLRGVTVFLFDCTLGTRTLIGQKHLHLQEVLCFQEETEDLTSDDKDNISMAMQQAHKIFMNDQISISLTLVDFSDLVFDYHANPGGFYYTVNLVDNLGKTVYHSSIDNHVKSRVTINAADGLFCADYVRLDLYDGNLVGYVAAGSVYIPMTHFEDPGKTSNTPIVYEVVKPNMREQVDSRSPNHDYFGKVELSFEVNIDSSGPGRASFSLASVLYRSNLFTTGYLAEAMLSGGVDKALEEGFVEKYAVVPAYDGMVLMDIDRTFNDEEGVSQTEKGNKKDDEKEKKSRALSDGDSADPTMILSDKVKRTTMSTMLGDDEEDEMTKEVEVYENMRRAFSHGLDWQHVKKAMFTGKSIKSKLPIQELRQCKPPSGYRWADEWEIDKVWTSTDTDGWVYAADFNSMTFNLAHGIHFTNAFLQSVRRRKWIRLAVRATRNEEDLTIDEHEEEEEEEEEDEGDDVSKTSTTTSPSKMTSSKRRSIFSKGKNKVKSLFRSKKDTSKQRESDSGATDTWRSKLLSRYPHAFLSLCKERVSPRHPIMLSWTQIKSIEVVTDSELYITAEVSRYMGQDKPGQDEYRYAEATIFVTGCPANALKEMYEERIMFDSTRTDLLNVMRQGTLFTEEEAKMMEENNNIFQAEELPQGSRLITNLDSDAMFLERAADDIAADLDGGRLDGGVAGIQERRWAKFSGRACRFRLYIATLLAEEIQGRHEYDLGEIKKLLNRDFAVAKCIESKDDIVTANDRVEFLLDVAEMRLREAALCGWGHRGRVLNECLGALVNGYFIEMVGTMGAFFESTTIRGVKGMGGKLDLIRTYMAHNDRLALLLDSVCQPYRIMTDPKPQLSLFLNVDTLLAWYSQVLEDAMVGVVGSCVNVWKDITKKTSKLTNMYKHPLPWIHDREESSGRFRTFIPEDSLRNLGQYIMCARLQKSDIAPSFHHSVDKLDVKVHTAYVNSLIYLSEQYWSGLRQQDWTKVSAESLNSTEATTEELIEHTEWLCSTINDAHRCVKDTIAAPSKMPQWNRDHIINNTQVVTMRCYLGFKNYLMRATDWLTCVIITRVLQDREFNVLFNSKGALLKKWFSTLPDLLHHGQDDSIILTVATATIELFTELRGFVNDVCYHKMLVAFADKITAIYLYMLRHARAEKSRFSQDGPEVLQMERDLAVLEEKFTEAALGATDIGEGIGDYQVTGLFQTLGMVLQLITSDLAGAKFKAVVDYFEGLAAKSPQLCHSVSAMLKTTVKLRYDCRSRSDKNGTRGATSAVAHMFSFSSPSSPSTGMAGGPFDTNAPLKIEQDMDSRVLEAFEMINNIERLHSRDSEITSKDDMLLSGAEKAGSARAGDPITWIFPSSSEEMRRALNKPLAQILTSTARHAHTKDKAATVLSEGLTSGNARVFDVKTAHTSTLFTVNSTRKPHLYLEFYSGNKLLCRSGVVKEEMRPNWSDNGIRLDLRGLSARAITIYIMVKNYILSDHPLGVVSVPLLSQDLIHREEAYPIDCSVNPASAEALEEAIGTTDLKPPVFFITLLAAQDQFSDPK